MPLELASLPPISANSTLFLVYLAKSRRRELPISTFCSIRGTSVTSSPVSERCCRTTLARSISSCVISCAAREEAAAPARVSRRSRSEEHTSELQSRGHLVCRLLLEKKKTRV